MQTNEITCPRCSAQNCKKNGISKQGKQRYRCKTCQRQFILLYTRRGFSSKIKQQIVTMCLNGSGIRDTARVLQVSANTVLKVLRLVAETLPPTKLPPRVLELELDEMWSFVGKKDEQFWLWYAFEPRSKQILAWHCGRRTDASCRRLLNKLKSTQVLRFCTDDWESYEKLIPAHHHWIGKQWTQRIERQNLNLRTHLKRLQRRTICFSKSKRMHEAVIKLYIHHHNQQHLL